MHRPIMTKERLELLNKERTPLGECLERTYKHTEHLHPDNFAKLVQLFEAYEEQAGLAELFLRTTTNPEYIYGVEWFVNDAVYGYGTSITQLKKEIRTLYSLNHFVEFARKWLKLSLADTLRFLKFVG